MPRTDFVTGFFRPFHMHYPPSHNESALGFSHFIDEKIEPQDYHTLLTDYGHVNEKSHSVDTLGHQRRHFS